MAKYQRLQNSEGTSLDLIGRRYKQAIMKLMCCDCGLVHDIVLVVDVKDLSSIGMALKRNTRATSAARRHSKKKVV